MTKKTSAKKSGAKVPAAKKAPAAKKPTVVNKKASAKKPVISTKPAQEKVSVAPAIVETILEHVVDAPVSTQETPEVPKAPVTPPAVAKPVVKQAARPVTPVNPNEVKTRKTSVKPGDIAEGDTDKGGRFEVFVGETKIGEVAFCSTPRIRDGEPSGFRRNWRGEDTNGKVLFTDGKRMNYMVAQLVAASKGVVLEPKRESPVVLAAPAEQVNASQGASA